MRRTAFGVLAAHGTHTHRAHGSGRGPAVSIRSDAQGHVLRIRTLEQARRPLPSSAVLTGLAGAATGGAALLRRHHTAPPSAPCGRPAELLRHARSQPSAGERLRPGGTPSNRPVPARMRPVPVRAVEDEDTPLPRSSATSASPASRPPSAAACTAAAPGARSDRPTPAGAAATRCRRTGAPPVPPATSTAKCAPHRADGDEVEHSGHARPDEPVRVA